MFYPGRKNGKMRSFRFSDRTMERLDLIVEQLRKKTNLGLSVLEWNRTTVLESLIEKEATALELAARAAIVKAPKPMTKGKRK